jgi:hypothetical protein
MREKNFNTGLRGTLFEAQHCRRMGAAVWLYGWLVLRQTGQKDGFGLVLGGKPVSYHEIEEETGYPRKTMERWMSVLRSGGYIETNAAPGGVIIRITKAKKFCRPPVDVRGVRTSARKISTGREIPTGRVSSELRMPHLNSGDRPPQNCGANEGQASGNAGVAAGIGSWIDKDINRKKEPSTIPEEDKFKITETRDAIRSLAGRMSFGNGAARRDAEVQRELRVGQGPVCRQ